MEREDVVIVATVSAIYGLGDPVEYRRLMVTVRTGENRGPRRHPRRPGAHPVRPQRRCASSRAPSGCGATPSRSSRPTRSRRSGSSSGATRSSGSAKIDPLTGEHHRRARPAAPSIRPSTSSPSAPPSSARSRLIRAELAERLQELKTRGQAARGAATRVAHQLRHRDAARGRAPAPASRTTRGTSAAGAAGERPACLLDYFPRGVPRGGGRVARVAAADRRDVQRRPRPQGDPRRVRLPAAVGARQPPAAVRGVHGAGAADDQRLGHAGRARAAALRAASSSSRSSGRPAWSIPRSRSAR